ncbi:MAG: PQQ-binding-like beta-propeller repeat protein, partial [Acidobacteria bacterium]|nr:PQQ-binding-like beta-propeller repeat protein [Acidobacteriota bacterium]
GVADAKGLPVHFGPTKNVAWKVDVPFGRSSPVVVSNRVFLTATENNPVLTLAYDLATGRELSRRALKPAQIQPTHKANDPASPTPVADPKNLYAFFPDFGLIAYSHAGKERWRHPLGPFDNFYGMSSSPILAGGQLLLLCDHAKGSFLLSLDPATGKQRWRTERPESAEGWSVPFAHQDQLIAVGSTRVDSYHLSTGEKRWWLPLPSNGSMGTPVVFGDSVLVTASGDDQPWLPTFAATLAEYDKNADQKVSLAEGAKNEAIAENFGWLDQNKDGEIDTAEWEGARQMGLGEYGAVAIPLNGKGKLESSAVRWRVKRNLPYIPSSILFDGVFYMVKDGGILTSLDPATGATLKQGRATGALGAYFASPVAADGKLYTVNSEGKMTVLKAGPQWEILALNDLGDEAFSTPAIVGNRLLVRTRNTLFNFTQNDTK